MSKCKIIMTGYYRVSTKAESQLTSYEHQPAYFRTKLQEPQFSNYSPTENFYCDYGMSGTKLDRPGFKKMLEDAGLDVEIEDRAPVPHPNHPDRIMRQRIYNVSVNPNKKPLFNEIWVSTTSRFARNINAEEILRTLRKAGVYVYFLDLDVSTKQLENMTLIRNKLSEDQGYSEQLSRHRKIVQKQYELENRLLGCPFGYNYHPKTNTTMPYYTINKQQSEIVLKVYKYCIDGLGIKAISKKLASEGHYAIKKVVENGKEKTIKKPFAPSQIRNILSQEKYKGLNTIGKWETGNLFEKYSSAKKREDYICRLKENPGLPAIITEELWNKAQEALHSRRIEPQDSHSAGKNQPTHPFKELLECGLCGSHFVYDHNGGRGYFKCSTKRNEGYHTCDCNNLFEYRLDSFIDSLAQGELHAIIENDFFSTIQTLVLITQNYIEVLTEPSKLESTSKELQALQLQLENKKGAREKLFDLLEEGMFSSDSMDSIKSRMIVIDADIKELNETISKLMISQEDLIQRINNLFCIIWNSFKTYKEKKKTYTHEEIIGLLSKIKVFGKTICNSGGKPPHPVLIPILKTTEQTEGLISAGYSEFKFKIKDPLAAYEPPDDAETISPLDLDSTTYEEKQAVFDKTTKSNWTVTNSKYLPFAPDDFTPDLGFEDHPIMQQLEDYTSSLYQKFTQFTIHNT